METVGSRIRTLREGSGFTQKRIAETIGVVQSAINRYENNHSDAPYKVLLWYADYFDVSMDYICLLYTSRCV